MRTDEFEQTLRDRMKAHAAELDYALSPAPALRTLLTDRQLPERSTGIGRLRLGLSLAAVTVAAVAVVALALLSGTFWAAGLPSTSPLSSATPSPRATLASISPSPSVSPAVTPPPAELSAAVLTSLAMPAHTEGVGQER